MTGVPRDLLVPRDFIMLHLDLVDMVPSLESAVLLLRIQYRAGDGWWEVTKAEMQTETRLSERKLDRALRELLDAGFIEWERVSPTDNLRKCRVKYDGGVGTKRPEGRDETSRTPSIKTSKTSSRSTERRPAKVQSTETPEFVAFYNLYPLKKARADARKAWAQVMKTGESVECVMSGLRIHLPALQAAKPDGFCPYPARWLRAEGWNDELTPLRHSKEAADYSHLSRYERRERQPGESHDQWQRRVFL